MVITTSFPQHRLTDSWTSHIFLIMLLYYENSKESFSSVQLNFVCIAPYHCKVISGHFRCRAQSDDVRRKLIVPAERKHQGNCGGEKKHLLIKVQKP